MLDPDDFIDHEEIFADDYDGQADADEDYDIYHASFTIVPGGDVDHATLVFWRNGVEHFRQQWGISLYYGYRYNGQDIPISEERAQHILENIGGDVDEYDWEAQDWVYVE